MAGRRTRDALKKKLVELGVITDAGVVVIAGLSNGYADYTTTFEEFQAQRYVRRWGAAVVAVAGEPVPMPRPPAQQTRTPAAGGKP